MSHQYIGADPAATARAILRASLRMVRVGMSPGSICDAALALVRGA